MSNLDVAVATFWQLARHWKNGDKAKLELSCEGESLDIQLSARLGPPEQQHFPDPPPIIPSVKKKSPSQLRRQERRRQEALSKSNMPTTKESEKDASENITVVEEAVKSKENSDNSMKKSSKKNVAEKVTISGEAGNSKSCADKPAINPFEKEAEVLSSSLGFKCDQCNYTSNSDKGLKTHTRMKHRISQLDGHEEEADEPDIVNKEKTTDFEESKIKNVQCVFCPEDNGYCHCGKCEDCESMRTTLGMNIHIINEHEPKMIYNHFGYDWVMEHRNLISGTYSPVWKRTWRDLNVYVSNA